MHLVELFGRKNSGEIARQRLKLLLVSDRAGLLAGTAGDDTQ